MGIPCITDADMIVDQYRYLLLFRSSRLIGHIVQNFGRGDSNNRICPNLLTIQQSHSDSSVCADAFHRCSNFFDVSAKLAGYRHISRCDASAS
ncbi:hypothetical protein WP12_16325 [Sphingomonas sp. SRS2]|nr:hypothetical protein WP12_16325 [Sphingomonas sp. SRS2]